MFELNQLAKLGQSVWYDNMRRALLDSGELAALLDAGIVGVTADFSSFEKAISGSMDYDTAIEALAAEGKPADAILEALILEDIGQVADLLRPIYDRTEGLDGYVSLDVSPALAHDANKTIAEARRLFMMLNRPNVMVKVPATPAGIRAVEGLTAEGVNVNATLIFSLDTYEAAAEAYIAGLEQLAMAGGALSRVASVASFFLSELDTAADQALAELGNEDLQGKVAIANASTAYRHFRELFSDRMPRWDKLAAQGARPQRPLWASTSAMNPDTLYVESLIAPDTVNALSPRSLTAFLKHGEVVTVLDGRSIEAESQLARLSQLGVDLDTITRLLQEDGLAASVKTFQSLVLSVAEKRDRLRAGWKKMRVQSARYQDQVDRALAEMKRDEIMRRIWSHDHSVWKPEPSEISNRLGWLAAPETMRASASRLRAFTESVRGDGYTHVLLLGMGGSSLAPEVFYRTFGQPASRDNPYLELSVLDSTDPGQVQYYADGLDLARTLFIVATKSGGTAETLSFFKFFYNRTVAALGVAAAGDRFVAITDPGSKLADMARKYRFRETFLNDPNIGGRYSALSYFGLVPAALVGVEIELLLERARRGASNAESCNCPVDGDNLSARLGVVMGELATAGRDKLTIIASPAVESFGDWVEQLVAESTGKEGRGILPVVGEPIGSPEVYGQDRLFVHLRLNGDDSADEPLAMLAGVGHPVVTLRLKDEYDLGEQFFLWEMATAVAGYRLGIQPFDQPNVEAAKVLARKMVAEYMEKGELPAGEVAPTTAGALHVFLSQAGEGDYIALQAYVRPSQETDEALLALRRRLRDQYRLATTVGYGPRFLHSTGQLHKGDGGNGLFVQFTADAVHDVPIPDEAGALESTMSFGVLEMAQALGDGQALQEAGRRVIRFHLGTEVVSTLRQLAAGI